MADNAYTLAINNALASAKGMLGKNEVPNHAELQSYLKDGGQDLDPHKLAWCAAFVSASLQKAGLPVPTQVVKDSEFGPGAYAPNYLTYGSAVDPKNVQAGDILVANNGSHVGFAEGPTRQGPNGPEAQLLAGNERDASGQYAPGSYTNPATGAVANRSQVGQVGERWVPLSQYSARRYEPTDNQASTSAPATPSSPAPGTTINSTPAAQPPNTSAIIDTLSRNIAGIESGGWKNPYEALGPVVPGRGQAIGKYQVMPENVAGWTQAALGQAMTPDQFKANPQAQEAVFRDQMQRSLQLYGPKDAASIWFTGEPFNVAGGGANDRHTSNANYVARATAGLNDDGTFTPKTAPGPIDPSIIARGGYSPPIPGATPGTPGAPIGTSIAGLSPDQSKALMGNLSTLDKAMGGKGIGGGTGGADEPQPAQMGPAPPIRNMSNPAAFAPALWGNTLAGMQAPPQWSAAPPGQNPYASAGGQPIGQQFGMQLGSLQQMQQMMAMMGNPYGDAGNG